MQEKSMKLESGVEVVANGEDDMPSLEYVSTPAASWVVAAAASFPMQRPANAAAAAGAAAPSFNTPEQRIIQNISDEQMKQVARFALANDENGFLNLLSSLPSARDANGMVNVGNL